jgi:hypothetical protein
VGVNLNPAQQINIFFATTSFRLLCAFRLLCPDVDVNLNPAQQIKIFSDLRRNLSVNDGFLGY